jgi:IS1 family transposase
MSGMNRLSTEERARIVAVLVEGNSLRATARITGFARMTVEKLLRDLGAACADYQNATLRNLPCKRIQCDEIWSFVYAKAKNLPQAKRRQFGFGDVWTWTAICADTKVVPCWLVGPRNSRAAREFLFDLSLRIRGRFQLTTDNHSAYPDAVERVFGHEIDYGTLTKLFGTDPENEKRYSPAHIIGIQAATISGNPDQRHISTSYVERQNLTMRMSMRRFTRLTNGFSKKIEMHQHAIALHFMHYNFARVHGALRVSPAMEAGVTSHLWDVEEIAGLLDENSGAISASA